MSRKIYTRPEIVDALAGALAAGMDRKTVYVVALICGVWADVQVAGGELIDAEGPPRQNP